MLIRHSFSFVMMMIRYSFVSLYLLPAAVERNPNELSSTSHFILGSFSVAAT
jgi:hypothetical protein